MVSQTSYRILAIAVLLAGAALRLTGLTRGQVDFVQPEQARTDPAVAFYAFHPDETTLIETARLLRHPLSPPQTVYGALPLYVARATLELGRRWPGSHEGQASGPGSRAHDYTAVRLAAALLSIAGLGLLWLLGRQVLDERAALLALCLVAATPMDLQQAHFYTVDTMFNTVMLLAVLALGDISRQTRYRSYLLAGALIGTLAAVRLSGILLVLLFVAIHVMASGWPAPAQALRRLRQPHLIVGLLAAAGVLLLMQPYLLTQPLRVFASGEVSDFGGALSIAQGRALTSWTLADLHTIPYLHHWTHLWPQGVGWPLTLAFLPGFWWALRRRDPLLTALAGWCVVYFLMVGGLHAKHVRYLLPLLPLLALFAAGLGVAVWDRRRRFGRMVVAVVVLATWLYGLAFTRIYRIDDSRIQAGRWIAAHVPAGVRIGVENGGFSMQGLISAERYARVTMDLAAPFQVRRFLSCRPTATHLLEQLQDLDWLAVVDVNRYRQFIAAPEISPATTAFYADLWAGRLGYELVQRFKVSPALGGLEFADDEAEPSFLGFDHPAVYVFRRQNPTEAEKAQATWLNQFDSDRRCPDTRLRQSGARWANGDLNGALKDLKATLNAHPDLIAGEFALAALLDSTGRPDEARQARARYLTALKQEQAGYLVHWATVVTLATADMGRLAPLALWQGAQLARFLPAQYRPNAASSYLAAARTLLRTGYRSEAMEACRLAARIDSTSSGHSRVGTFLLGVGEPGIAVELLQQAMSLDPGNTAAQVNLGWARYLQGDLHGAIAEYQRVLQTTRSSVALYDLGLAYLVQGNAPLAATVYAQVVAEFGAAEGLRIGAARDLRQLVDRGVAVEPARRILATYWPEH